MLPQDNAISDEVLGVPACDYAPEHQQQAAPLAELASSCEEEADNARQLTWALWPQEPGSGPRGFNTEQIKQLYLQLNHHCQLMVEVYALTACNSSHQESAAALLDLFADYQVSDCSQPCLLALSTAQQLTAVFCSMHGK